MRRERFSGQFSANSLTLLDQRVPFLADEVRFFITRPYSMPNIIQTNSLDRSCPTFRFLCHVGSPLRWTRMGNVLLSLETGLQQRACWQPKKTKKRIRRDFRLVRFTRFYFRIDIRSKAITSIFHWASSLYFKICYRRYVYARALGKCVDSLEPHEANPLTRSISFLLGRVKYAEHSVYSGMILCGKRSRR